MTLNKYQVRLPLLLRQMRLPSVSANYRKLAQEAAASGQPYEEYLLALLELEANQREINRRRRRLREAHFPVLRTLDEFDSPALRKRSAAQVLRLSPASSRSRCSTWLGASTSSARRT